MSELSPTDLRIKAAANDKLAAALKSALKRKRKEGVMPFKLEALPKGSAAVARSAVKQPAHVVTEVTPGHRKYTMRG